MNEETKGREVIELLARRFPQLYVAPAAGAEATHRLASTRGVVPDGANLRHFARDGEDSLRMIQTPAGPVEVVFLERREDFETFLRIVGHRSQPVQIAHTVGATTYRGLADWGAVMAARNEYLANGGDDWPSEFKRLAARPGTFRAELVVVSEGPYSDVSADETPYGEAEWLRVSREIRLYHECAHVVCRRLVPSDVLPVWDEITADVVGLLCATGRYDARLAALFLGVCGTGFVGGRLSEYVDGEQLGRINELALEVHAALTRIQVVADGAAEHPFDFLLELKRTPFIAY